MMTSTHMENKLIKIFVEYLRHALIEPFSGTLWLSDECQTGELRSGASFFAMAVVGIREKIVGVSEVLEGH